jgi:Protein of unknown function (DUF732)
VRELAAAAMAAPLVLLPIGVAHADANDDAFVQKVSNIGVNGAATDLISNAQQVCKSFDSANTVDDTINAFVSQWGWPCNRAAKFVALSVTYYCPKYSGLQTQKGC